MKNRMLFLPLMIVAPMVLAQDVLPPPLTLDKVLFNLSAKQWVTTQTALLTVSINATLSNADLVKARAEIMTRLNKVAQSDWHLVQFDRSQDSSGLEKLTVQAQARVNQSLLTDLYKNAKAISVPGAQYSISGVEFKPSLDEVQTVRATIRDKLYQQANDEVSRLNKVYTNQNYSLSNLIFMDGDNPPTPPVGYNRRTLNTMVMAAAVPAPLTVSNEIVMTAVVEVASNRK